MASKVNGEIRPAAEMEIRPIPAKESGLTVMDDRSYEEMRQSVVERLAIVKQQREEVDQRMINGTLTPEELKNLTPEQAAARDKNKRFRWRRGLQTMSAQFRTAEAFKSFLENEPEPGTLAHFRWRLGHVCEHWSTSLVVACLVLANAVMMGLYADHKISSTTFFTAALWFLCLFIIEIVLKMLAFGVHLYFKDAWNTFDFVVVAVSFIEIIVSSIVDTTAVASVTRLLRIFRVARLVSSLKELEVILSSFVNSLSAVTWVAVLTVIMLYIFGVIATLSFGRSEALAKAVPESQVYFGSVARSMFTMLQIMTMEWVEPTRAIGEYYQTAWPFFIAFLFFAGIGVLNLFTAIYVDRLQQLTKKQEQDAATEKVKRRNELEMELSEMFEIIDQDSSGTLDQDELKNALHLIDADGDGCIDNADLKNKLAEFGMTLETIEVALYKFGNKFKSRVHQNGEIEYKEFLRSVFTMNDPATRQDATEVNARISQEIDRDTERLVRLENKIVEVNSLVTQLLSTSGVGRTAQRPL